MKRAFARRPYTRSAKQQGMTLVELLTVMVIIAILAAIAYPSYRSFVIRSQRTDARVALLQVQAAEEKYMLKNNIYTNDVTSANGLGLTGFSEHGLYQIGIGPPVGDPTYQNGYVVTATPVVGKGQDQDSQCRALTIDGVGTKGTTGTATPAECWR